MDTKKTDIKKTLLCQNIGDHIGLSKRNAVCYVDTEKDLYAGDFGILHNGKRIFDKPIKAASGVMFGGSGFIIEPKGVISKYNTTGLVKGFIGVTQKIAVTYHKENGTDKTRIVSQNEREDVYPRFVPKSSTSSNGTSVICGTQGNFLLSTDYNLHHLNRVRLSVHQNIQCAQIVGDHIYFGIGDSFRGGIVSYNLLTGTEKIIDIPFLSLTERKSNVPYKMTSIGKTLYVGGNADKEWAGNRGQMMLFSLNTETGKIETIPTGIKSTCSFLSVERPGVLIVANNPGEAWRVEL